MSDTKENNEESGNEDAAVALDEGQLPKSNAQVKETQDSPHSVSVPIEETPILAENETETTTSTPSVSDDNKVIESQSIPDQPTHDDLVKPNIQPTSDVKTEDNDLPPQTNADASHTDTAEPALADAKTETYQVSDTKTDIVLPTTTTHNEPTTPHVGPSDSDIKPQFENGRELENKANEKGSTTPLNNGNSYSKPTFLLDDDHMSQGSESGTEEDQSAFMKELENFFRERSMEFKPPKFYGEGLNCLKLWRAVTRLGGYDKVTSCKLWRQVGESFKPPKTCTTVSWTFRGFYEKALLDYERHKTHGGELSVPIASHSEPMNIETQASGSGRARRDAAARAMQGWHSQRLLGNGEVSDPIIKDKNSISMQKREKQLKNIGLLKRKKPSYIEHTVKAARTKASKPQLDSTVVDIGAPADWVKINVQKTKDCFEVYALVPGLLREEVRVQSDPAGRLVISGEPEHPDNPWGVTPFKKVVSLPSRIDPHQTSAVVTLHGQLFVRVPFEQSE